MARSFWGRDMAKTTSGLAIIESGRIFTRPALKKINAPIKRERRLIFFIALITVV